jgi:hypothetical protein
MTKQEALSKVTVGSTLSVAFGFNHPFRYEYGRVEGRFLTNPGMLFVKFPGSGLVCGDLTVSEMASDGYPGDKLVLNPIATSDIEEDDLAVLMQIDSGLLNEEWSGGLFEVFAVDGVEIK